MERVRGGGSCDAILMNVDMSMMNGCMASRAIRLLEVTTYIIAWTCYLPFLKREACMRAGMDDFIEIDGGGLVGWGFASA